MSFEASQVAKPSMATGVLSLPVNKRGQYLLTLRNAPHTPQAHRKWQVTGGGMEFGETPEVTLVRECQEEIGVTPTILYPYPMVKTHVWEVSPRFHVTLICYLVDIGNQKVTPNIHETTDFRWFFPGEVKEIEFLPLTDVFIFNAEVIKKKYLS